VIAPLLLAVLGPAHPEAVEALRCPTELGFPLPESRCAAEDPASCCLGGAHGVSEDAATCIADAWGFAPGPGGRFVALDEEKGRWTLVSVGRTRCGEDPAVGVAQGCGLVLDAETGEVVSEGSIVWSGSCAD
jgi:hypothetical protein